MTNVIILEERERNRDRENMQEKNGKKLDENTDLGDRIDDILRDA